MKTSSGRSLASNTVLRILFALLLGLLPLHAAALEITTTNLPAGMEMVPYEVTLDAVNGSDFAWSFEPQIHVWGSTGQRPAPDGLHDAVAVAAGSIHDLAIKSDGTVVAWGSPAYGMTYVPAGLTNVVAVAAGNTHSMALQADGTLFSWGSNRLGQRDAPPDLTNVTAIAAGVAHSLAVRSDGTVVAWGQNDAGQATLPDGLEGAVAVAAGQYHSLALKSDGTVVAWGTNQYNLVTVPAAVSNVAAIAAGYSHNLALQSNGNVLAWGNNTSGQSSPPPSLSDVVAVSAGQYHSLALKSDGTVVVWGASSFGPPAMSADSGAVEAIGAGALHSLTVTSPRPDWPSWLSLSSDGTLSGVPTEAGTYSMQVLVTNSSGSAMRKEFEIVIGSNPNTRPIIEATQPEQGIVTMDENTTHVFSVTAHDPEGMPLTYQWMRNGTPVGDGSSTYTFVADWGDADTHILKCYVSDDLWDRVVFAQWNPIVAESPPSTVMGQVRGAGMPLEGASIRLREVLYGHEYETLTDADGNFVVSDVRSGYYHVKASAPLYRDVWYANSNHHDTALRLQVPGDAVVAGVDFNLIYGANPGFVRVESDPPGAEIFLNFWPTGKVTPALLKLTEVETTNITGDPVAQHTVTVRKDGYPQPSYRIVSAREAETVPLFFFLGLLSSGAVSVTTTPEGAEVYLNDAQTPKGVTPLVIDDLEMGMHMLFLRKEGYLLPRPYRVTMLPPVPLSVSVDLTPDSAPDRIIADVQSVPPGVSVYPNYLSSDLTTDTVIDLFDPATHSRPGVQPQPHTILLRQPGALPLAPRHVPELANTPHSMVIHLRVDPESDADCNGDGIPDWWWDLYGFDPCSPPDADSAADASERSYRDKLHASLTPGDPDSRFGLEEVQRVEGGNGEVAITFVFDSVPGRRYLLQANDGGGWLAVGGVIAASGHQTEHTLQLPADAQHQLYRVIVLSP